MQARAGGVEHRLVAAPYISPARHSRLSACLYVRMPAMAEKWPARYLRECVICGEKVTISNATEKWEAAHATATSSAHEV